MKRVGRYLSKSNAGSSLRDPAKTVGFLDAAFRTTNVPAGSPVRDPALLIIFFLILLLPLSGNAKTIEVCQQCPVSSIKKALEMADDGDRIEIQKGTYTEGNITVTKEVHLKGIDWPVIDGENKTEILTIKANNVTIEGLVIQNVGVDYLEDRAGICMVKSKNFVIRNNKLYNTFFGIYLEHAKSGIVADNEIRGQAEVESSSGNAIHAWYCKDIEVTNNTVIQHRDGIYFEFVDNSIITGNHSEKNIRYGLHFMFSNENSYSQNTFRDNGAGVAVMFSKKIDMENNTFEQNWGKSAYGILLKEIYDANILNNRFIENTTGIYIEGSTRINYRQNEFKRNGWAVNMAGGSLDNVFTENSFRSNTLDLVINGRVNNNTFNGNYWSEYSGYDLDRDGIGDVPHRPVKLFSYILGKSQESIILLRSLFVDIINFSEKVSPVFTPENVLDQTPSMHPYHD